MTVPAGPVAVTGVASGGLGTAANLEDTQLWGLEDLRASEPADEFEPDAPAEPAEAKPVPAAVIWAPRGQRRTGLMAAAAVGIIALAALLALRDGLPGGATGGGGNAAGAFPSLPAAASIGPQATAAPDTGASGKGHGNNGNGNGHGNGH